MLRFSRRALFLGPLATAVVATVACLLPADAQACGGCIYAPPPPDQPAQSTSVVTDHRMVLSLGTSTTTLWDQIEYAGAPSDFAWVLPTRGPVKVAVGANAFIDALDQITAPVVHAPRLICNTPPGGFGSGGSGGCNMGCGSASDDGAVGFSPPAEDTGVPSEDSGVVITGKSTAGPYDVVQIHGTDEGAIVGWLRKHDYVIPKDVEPILTRYVDEGFDFVAVRLSPGKGVQAMKPIRVTFDGKYPTLPLRMVAAGVGANVGIKLFVIGDGRWKAKNFETFLIQSSSLTWDFATSRSDYTTVRAETAAKFPNGAFGLESSVDIGRSYLPTKDPDGPDAGTKDTGDVPVHDTGAADTSIDDASESGTDATADATDATDATDTATDTATDAAIDDGVDVGGADETTDVDIAFGSYSSRRVTRLRADLPTAALGIDLQLEADDPQTLVPTDLYLVKYKNEDRYCPNGATLISGPRGSILELSDRSTSAQCNTSGGEGSPLRVPLLTVAGFLVVSIGRRAIRKRKSRTLA